MRGHSFPGLVKSRGYKKHRAILEKLFKKFRKENKENKVIFVSHNVPYKTKLDKVLDKNAEKIVRNKHAGSKLAQRIIKKFQPIIAIGGHVHEGFGKDKIGKTLVINSGSAVNNEFVVLDFDEERGKLVSVDFYKGNRKVKKK